MQPLRHLVGIVGLLIVAIFGFPRVVNAQSNFKIFDSDLQQPTFFPPNTSNQSILMINPPITLTPQKITPVPTQELVPITIATVDATERYIVTLRLPSSSQEHVCLTPCSLNLRPGSLSFTVTELESGNRHPYNVTIPPVPSTLRIHFGCSSCAIGGGALFGLGFPASLVGLVFTLTRTETTTNSLGMTIKKPSPTYSSGKPLLFSGLGAMVGGITLAVAGGSDYVSIELENCASGSSGAKSDGPKQKIDAPSVQWTGLNLLPTSSKSGLIGTALYF